MRPEAPPQAFYEYRFLLARGYTPEAALEALRRRHSLGRRQLILLRRCIHPPELDQRVRSRLLTPRALRGERLAVDGFNQLATVYAGLTGHPVYRCSDGLTRDSMLSGPKPVVKHAEQLAKLLAAALKTLHLSEAVVVLDSQPSRSGEAAAAMRSHGVRARVSPRADTELLNLAHRGYAVATSDVVIASRAAKLFDLAGYMLRLMGAGRAVTDIPRLLEREHEKWCRGEGP